MAVEARHLNIFPPQILGNREMMMTMMNGVGILPSTAVETVAVPTYTSASNDVVPLKNAPLQSDSGLTYAAAAVPSASRKRAREFAFNSHPMPIVTVGQSHYDDGGGGPFTFLGEDISPYLLQQQSDIDRFIAQYTDQVRLEMQQRRNQYSRGIAATVEESMMKKLKAKEDEIQKIAKLNCMLEERVKSLSMENQIWRELAQSNEATANALRSNLEQVLAQVQGDHQLRAQQPPPPESLAGDAQSCCGSNYNEEDERDDLNIINNRICRSCGREESCVLILPCRHLCVCTVCSSSVHACPMCNSTKTRTLHVNLSS